MIATGCQRQTHIFGVKQSFHLTGRVDGPLESRCFYLHKLRYTYQNLYFRLVVTIFWLTITQRRKVITPVPPCYWTPKCRISRLNLHAIIRIQAKLCKLKYVLPVNGSHLWFTSHLDDRQYLNQTHRVTGSWKYKSSCWNLEAVICSSWYNR